MNLLIPVSASSKLAPIILHEIVTFLPQNKRKFKKKQKHLLDQLTCHFKVFIIKKTQTPLKHSHISALYSKTQHVAPNTPKHTVMHSINNYPLVSHNTNPALYNVKQRILWREIKPQGISKQYDTQGFTAAHLISSGMWTWRVLDSASSSMLTGTSFSRQGFGCLGCLSIFLEVNGVTLL